MNGISIHPGFPPAKVLDTFEPFLRDYMCESFSLNPTLKYRASLNLKKSLLRFGRLNPTYGRKIIDTTPDTLNSDDSSSDDDMISLVGGSSSRFFRGVNTKAKKITKLERSMSSNSGSSA